MGMATTNSTDNDDVNLEDERDRIRQTAEKQLTSVHSLNALLVKKIRKAETQTTVLLHENRCLEDKNANLVAQLSRAQEEIRILESKEQSLVKTERDGDAVKDSTADTDLAAQNTAAGEQVEVMPKADPFSKTLEEIELKKDSLLKAFERDFAALHEMKGSMARRIQKAEAQTATLLIENQLLSDKNADLAAQLSRAQEDIRTLSMKEQALVEAERSLDAAKSAIASSELAVKETQKGLHAAAAERDSLQRELSTVKTRLDTATSELQESQDAAEAERAQLHGFLEERGLALAAMTTERDDNVMEKKGLLAVLKERDGEVEELQKKIVSITTDADKVKSELGDEVAGLKMQVEALTAIVAERDNNVGEEGALQASLTERDDEGDELQKQTVSVADDGNAAAAEVAAEIANLMKRILRPLPIQKGTHQKK